MSPTTFRTLCEAIYGVAWCTSRVARDLKRESRTVRRWKSGESPVPKAVQKWLIEQADNPNRKEHQ